MTLHEQLRRVHAGEISFDTMARNTRADWRAMAQRLMQRPMLLPASVTVDDVAQEMLLAAWQALRNFDPSKGPALQTHVVWRAHTAAKRWLDGQRGLRVGVKGNAQRRSACLPSVSDVDRRNAQRSDGGDMRSVLDDVPSESYVAELLDLMGLARAEHERAIMHGIVAGVDLSELADQVFGEDVGVERVRTTALVCLSRRTA